MLRIPSPRPPSPGWLVPYTSARKASRPRSASSTALDTVRKSGRAGS
jgi:hypothetical protein